MVDPPLLLLLTVGIPQESCLRAMFRSLIDDRQVKLDRFFTVDSVTAAAWSFLLRSADRHVAVVLETWSEDPGKIREIYESGCRRIERNISSSRNEWHVAVAVPNLTAWALVDDHVREEYQKIRQDPATAATPEELDRIEQANFRALASRIGEWTADRPFDLEALKQKSRQVRELCKFIDVSLHPEPEPVLATAADWF